VKVRLLSRVPPSVSIYISFLNHCLTKLNSEKYQLIRWHLF